MRCPLAVAFVVGGCCFCCGQPGGRKPTDWPHVQWHLAVLDSVDVWVRVSGGAPRGFAKCTVCGLL
jgi:hypothetical protein